MSQTEIEEEENDDSDERNQEQPSRSKVESALVALKDAALYSDIGNEIQSIIFKFEKLYRTEPLNSLKQKDIKYFFSYLKFRSNYLG